jgi:hypothetical protein
MKKQEQKIYNPEINILLWISIVLNLLSINIGNFSVFIDEYLYV